MRRLSISRAAMPGGIVRTVHTRTLTTFGVMSFFAATFALSWMSKILRTANDLHEPAESGAVGVYLGCEGVVLQDKSNNCGPAALKMILDHYGVPASVREIERRTRLTRDGSSLFALKKTAESFGMGAEGWRMKLEDLVKRRFPLIIFVEGRHFVVVDSVNRSGCFFVRDPAIGRLRISSRKLGDIWKGETLIFSESVLPRE